MAITTSSGERYDSLEQFIGHSPSEFVDTDTLENDPNATSDMTGIAKFKTPSRLDYSNQMKKDVEQNRDAIGEDPTIIPGMPIQDPEGQGRNVVVSENQGPGTQEDWNNWSTFYGARDIKNLDKDLEDGSVIIRKNHPGIDEYLKNNPDIPYNENDEHYLLKPRPKAPLVGFMSVPESVKRDAKQMTHESEKPNLAQPFLQGVKDFIGGGIHQVLKNQGVQFPDWIEKAGDVVNNPDNQAAMGLFGGRFTPAAKSLAEAMEAKGFSEPSIKYMSGLERGSEGMWRLEMNDSASVFKGVNGIKPLGQVLEHDQLFKRYPEARDIPIALGSDKMMEKNRAYFDADIGMIVLKKSLSKEVQHSSLLHEIQHWIQQKEGFSFGSADFLNSEEKKQFLDLIGNPKNPDYQMYKHMASEVEARNVQKRMNMSPSQTGQTLGKETEDVDRLKQMTNLFGDQKPTVYLKDFTTDEFGNLSRTVGTPGEKAVATGPKRPGTKPGTPSPLKGTSKWDKEDETKLQEMIDKGSTFQQIADELGFTRNKVAGKASRLSK